MNILGIETSCDETGVALFDTTRGLIANRLHSQVDLHAVYGGVVPEIASRDHVRKGPPDAVSRIRSMSRAREPARHWKTARLL